MATTPLSPTITPIMIPILSVGGASISVSQDQHTFVLSDLNRQATEWDQRWNLQFTVAWEHQILDEDTIRFNLMSVTINKFWTEQLRPNVGSLMWRIRAGLAPVSYQIGINADPQFDWPLIDAINYNNNTAVNIPLNAVEPMIWAQDIDIGQTVRTPNLFAYFNRWSGGVVGSGTDLGYVAFDLSIKYYMPGSRVISGIERSCNRVGGSNERMVAGAGQKLYTTAGGILTNNPPQRRSSNQNFNQNLIGME